MDEVIGRGAHVAAVDSEIGQGFGRMAAAEFHIRTIEEARRLSAFLAEIYPQLALAEIGLMELLINSIEHGNLGVTFAEKTRLLQEGRWREELERRLDLPENLDKRSVVAVDADDAGMRISIQDQGGGFDPEPYLDAEAGMTMDAHGRGIFLASKVGFSSLRYEDGGRRVVVTLEA